MVRLRSKTCRSRRTRGVAVVLKELRSPQQASVGSKTRSAKQKPILFLVAVLAHSWQLITCWSRVRVFENREVENRPNRVMVYATPVPTPFTYSLNSSIDFRFSILDSRARLKPRYILPQRDCHHAEHGRSDNCGRQKIDIKAVF